MKDKTAQLLAAWVDLKAQEASATQQRLKVEAKLLGLVESVDDGSKTSHVDGYKVTVKNGVKRSVDQKAWTAIAKQIPKHLHPVKVKYEADTKGCKYLAENFPKIWILAAKAITEKPSKPGFTIEKEEE